MKLLFFDTETTDITPGHIAQISYVIVDTSVKPQTTVAKNLFFTVEEISESAKAVHGLTPEMLYELSEGLYFEDFAENLHDDFSSADWIIGHNVAFDLKFITNDFEELGIDYSYLNTFDTMTYYKDILKLKGSGASFKNPTLKELNVFLGITDTDIQNTSMKFFGDSIGYHDSRYDVVATYLSVVRGIMNGMIPKNYFTNNLTK